MSRDPRFQPVAGDVLTNGRNTFYVSRVTDTEVFYTEDHPPVSEESVTLGEWRAYSKAGQVVTVGEVVPS